MANGLLFFTDNTGFAALNSAGRRVKRKVADLYYAIWRRLRESSATHISNSDDLVAREQELISCARRRNAKSPWKGIALSGGGIRSATFSLGVLQALAAYDLLKRFDYLSSVSGGGYIAGALCWWWSNRRQREELESETTDAEAFGTGPKDFPFGTSHPSPNRFDAMGKETPKQVKILTHLRDHSNYLIPGNGINLWSAAAVALRTPFLNVMVWMPIATVLFLVLVNLDDATNLSTRVSFIYHWSPLPDTVIPTYNTLCPSQEAKCHLHLRAPFVLAILISICSVALLGLFSVFLIFSSRIPDVSPAANSTTSIIVRWLKPAAVLAIGAFAFYYTDQVARYLNPFTAGVLGVFFLIARCFFFAPGMVLLVLAIFETFKKEGTRNISYAMRRSFELYSGKALLPATILLGLGFVPVVPYQVMYSPQASEQAASGGLGLAAILAGIVSALYTHYILVRNVNLGFIARMLASLSAGLFLYVILIISYALAVFLVRPEILDFPTDEASGAYLSITALFILAVVMSFFVNINQIGLHRYYRDRLMEAFMPAGTMVKQNRAGYSSHADSLVLSELWSQTKRDAANGRLSRPYPIINTNAILVNDSDSKYAKRGGDSFILSPLYIGSSATGWERTTAHANSHGPVTLASAMAVSGAAANANAGYVGTGLARNWLISMMMILLNMRLGLWIRTPVQLQWRLRQQQPNHWRPGITYAFLRGHKRKRAFIELSDGGHFENLGLYELVRRKVRVILVIDGEADPSTSFSALVSAARRIKEDFDATISFDAENGPERLFAATEMRFPPRASYADWPFLVAEIKYKDGTLGAIIYVKAVTIKDLSFISLGYKAKNPDFPNQTTLDQFFSTDQFEAYRELGYQSLATVVKELELLKTVNSPNRILQKYRELSKAKPLVESA